jgi:hypothetical protein
MTKQAIDIDALLAERFPDEDTPVALVPAVIAGQSFMIRQDINAYQLASLQDPDRVAAAMTQILLNAVEEDERERLVKTLGSIPRLSVEKLGFIFNAVLEAAAGGTPTQSSSGSRRTTPKKVVAKRSAAR